MNAYRRPRRKNVRPSVRPQAAGVVMDDLFRWLKLDEPARAFLALKAFAVAAGPRIAARARAEKLRGSILFIRVSSSAWAQNLHALQAELLEKLKRTPGGDAVTTLRFNVGPLDEVPDWNAIPAVEPGRAPEMPSLDEEMRRAVSAVRDPELRDELGRLLALGPSGRQP